jgi:predicted nuclease of predicted toxin-antitoxin system
MSVQLVVDMNLSVEWVTELARHGWSAVHWSSVGDPGADDSVIMAWAVANGYVVFTHDLDFGTMLALTHATGPSVLQVRSQTVLPEDIGAVVVAALRQYESALAAGALVVVELRKTRVRVLPL